MKDPKDKDQERQGKQMGNNPSDAGSVQQQQGNPGGARKPDGSVSGQQIPDTDAAQKGTTRVTPGGGQSAQQSQSGRGAGQFGDSPQKVLQGDRQAPDSGSSASRQHQMGGAGTTQQGSAQPAASGSHQSLQGHASGHDQVGKSAGRTNSNDDSGNAPHRGG